MRLIKIFKYFFEFIFLVILFFIVKLLGIKFGRKLCAKIFIFIGPMFRSNKIIKKNLEIFDRSENTNTKNSMIDSMWNNYGKTFSEYMFLKKFRYNNNHIEVKGLEHLEQIKNKNKPVIFFSGHFANFELMSMELTKRNLNFASIYRPLNNFFLNPIMEYLRRKYVCSNQIKKGLAGVKDIVKYIEKGFSIALMADQRLSEGEKIPFFGSDALTTTLPAQLSLKYNLDIVPIYIARDSNDNFMMEIFKPLEKKNNDNEISKNLITLQINQEIEKMIKKNPSMWIWSHNRWK